MNKRRWLFVLGWLLSSAFLSVFGVEPAASRRTVAAEHFDKFIKITPPPSAVSKLQAIGIDICRLKQCDTPANCTVDFTTLPRDFRLEKRGNGFLIGSADKITLQGPRINPTGSSYMVEATVRASEGEAVVAPGVAMYGLYAPGNRFLRAEKLAPGERKILTFPVDLSCHFAPFRPIFRVHGNVVFESISVQQFTTISQNELRVVEGTVVECSVLPDPKKSNYPDCRFTCRFEGNAIFMGKPCPRELQLVLEGFSNYSILGTGTLKAGDKVVCAILPFEKLPPERQTTQQADDLNLFSLESYYAVGIYKVPEFIELFGVSSSGIAFSDVSCKPYVSVFERHVNPPLSEAECDAVRAEIAAELKRVEAMLYPYTPEKIVALRKEFGCAWERERAKDIPGRNRIIHRSVKYVWRNVDNSFWALPENYRIPPVVENPIPPENLNALIALRDFLNANGCQLLISPVPDFQAIAARVILPGFRDIPDFQTAVVIRQLLKNGIWTFYPSDTLIANFNRYKSAFFFPLDDHPADTVQDVMTDIVSGKLACFDFKRDIAPESFSVVLVPNCVAGNRLYRIPSNCDVGIGASEAIYLCRRVLCNNKPIYPDAASPVLVVGNSFMKTPLSYPDAFPALLSLKLNMGIDARRVGAFGPMTVVVQQFFTSPETTLRGKKVVVLAIGAKHLLTPVRFNNIRQMDEQAKFMTGKKMRMCIPLESNTRRDMSTRYPGLFSPNFVEVPVTGKLLLADRTIGNCNSNSPVIVVIPSCFSGKIDKAEYVINGRKVTIPECSGRYRHLNAVCELPAGTTTLIVEVVGSPQTVLSIRNIQIYQ